MIILTAIKDTFLKKSTNAATTLGEYEKVSVPKGKEYKVETVTGRKDGHTQYEFAYKLGEWWIYTGSDSIPGTGHWNIPREDLITRVQAETVFGNVIYANELQDLNQCLKDFKINTPARIRHFLAQIAHESGGLKWLAELATGDDYEWREDLGNTQAGDGRKYKGAGAIQLTGRANYQAFSEWKRDAKIMNGWEYVSKVYPFSSAGFFWDRNDINDLCDQGASVAEVTRVVNGGYNGLEDREHYYSIAATVV